MTEDEMAGWHHWLDGRESEWTLGVGDGQGGLACCDSWGRKEWDTTEWLIWSDLKYKELTISSCVEVDDNYLILYTENMWSLLFYHLLYNKWKLFSHVWLFDPMDCSLPGSPVHGILQARILEWVIISFSNYIIKSFKLISRKICHYFRMVLL